MKAKFFVYIEGKQVPYSHAVKKFPFLSKRAYFLRKMLCSISEIRDCETISSLVESYRTKQGIKIDLFCEVKK